MSDFMQLSTRGRVLYVIAAAFLLPPLIRGVTGFYNSDLPWMLAMLAISAVLFFVGNRMGKDGA